MDLKIKEIVFIANTVLFASTMVIINTILSTSGSDWEQMVKKILRISFACMIVQGVKSYKVKTPTQLNIITLFLCNLVTLVTYESALEALRNNPVFHYYDL